MELAMSSSCHLQNSALSALANAPPCRKTPLMPVCRAANLGLNSSKKLSFPTRLCSYGAFSRTASTRSYRRVPVQLFRTSQVDRHSRGGASSYKCSSLRLKMQFKPSKYFREVPNACSQVGAAESSDPVSSKVSQFRDAVWRFLRPHTIRGTALGSLSLVTRALIENPNLIRWSLVVKALCGLLALLCGNGYIVGINQIYDIGIDKVNKPYLPIAAGDLSVQSAWFLVLLFAATGLLIVGLNFGPFITALYSIGLFLGTIYSVPPFRMKRYPVVAFLIIATVRGFLLNYGVYYATRAALGLTFEWSSPVAFITTFVTLFALVIAITKDLPDVEGDRKFQISTLATKLGVRNIAFLGSGLLLINYISAVLVAIYMPQAFRGRLMIPVHVILAFSVILQTWILEKANYGKEAIAAFYRFIWNLFYAEYIIFPLI